MARELKALVVVAAVGMLVYFMAFAGTSVAEHGEHAEHVGHDEQFGGVTIFVEACVVRVEVEALEEIAAGSDILNLGSISAAKVLGCVESEDAEVISTIKLALGNDSDGEITTKETSTVKGKDNVGRADEHAQRDIAISFQAEAIVRTVEKIAVKFSFKQAVAEKASSTSGDQEQEEEVVDTFEVSSTLALETGRPRVVGAKKNDDAATFLILRADI